VLACLDPVGNETAYLQSILEDTKTEPWWDLYFDDPLRYVDYDDTHGRYDSKDLESKLRIDYLAAYRARHPASLTELAGIRA
jgi:hypothetical protein